MLMESATRDRLKGGFDAAAASYATSRPGYPPKAVEFLLGGDGARRSAVLDLGAGSGALTRLLAAPGRLVVAADPGSRLLAELSILAAGAVVVQAGAEALPFADASYDVVTVATAFHWFDPVRALSEIHRVLRPGGHLALAWNTRRHDVDWAVELNRLLRSAQPPGLTGDWGTGSVRVLDDSPLFEPPSYAEFPHAQRLDREGLLALVSSRSYVIALPPGARATLLAAVGNLFDSAAAGAGTVDLPYTCQCWCARTR
jgi:SAM-dependent methyltransferase